MSGTDLLSPFRIADAVTLITGGASGTGRACGHLFARAGARVILLDQNGDAARVTASEIGAGARALALDVTDESAVEQAFAEVARDEGRLDVLVNNAGLSLRHPTLDLSLGDWQRVVDVNMTGVFLCARAAARHMVPRSSGSIVNTASIMGLSGGGLYPNVAYHATKGAVVNMTRALAVEWARSGVRVNAVAPRDQISSPIRPRPDTECVGQEAVAPVEDSRLVPVLIIRQHRIQL